MLSNVKLAISLLSSSVVHMWHAIFCDPCPAPIVQSSFWPKLCQLCLCSRRADYTRLEHEVSPPFSAAPRLGRLIMPMAAHLVEASEGFNANVSCTNVAHLLAQPPTPHTFESCGWHVLICVALAGGCRARAGRGKHHLQLSSHGRRCLFVTPWPASRRYPCHHLHRSWRTRRYGSAAGVIPPL